MSKKTLLALGLFAGPVYIGLAILQIILRPEFDMTHHSLSLMSNGSLGWIQVTNFILTGLFVIVGGIGIRKTLKKNPGGTWGPLMLGLYGLGLIAAGFFKADPMGGFPPDSPTMNVVTTNGLLHLVSGSIGFIGLIAACFVFARKFYKDKNKGWGHYSLATGIIFFLAFAGIASGSQPNSPIITPVTLGFYFAVTWSFIWLTLLLKKFTSSK